MTVISQEAQQAMIEKAVDNEGLRLLLQFGIVASMRGAMPMANKLFAAARAIRANSPEIGYAQALALHNSGKTKEAMTELQNVIGRFPHHMLAKAMLAALYMLCNDSRWLSIANEVEKNGKDEAAVQLVKSIRGTKSTENVAVDKPQTALISHQLS